jgi:uncharacterized protein DUF6916
VPEPRWLTHELFVPHVGDVFVVRDRDLRLVLDAAREHELLGGPGPDGRQRRQFSLFFAGPVQPVLEQGTYPLHHDALGDLDLFLVPVGSGGDGIRYEAAFA